MSAREITARMTAILSKIIAGVEIGHVHAGDDETAVGATVDPQAVVATTNRRRPMLFATGTDMSAREIMFRIIAILSKIIAGEKIGHVHAVDDEMAVKRKSTYRPWWRKPRIFFQH